MKKLKYNIIIKVICISICLSTSLTSCMSYEECKARSSSPAKLIFDKTDKEIKNYITTLDLAIQVNLYLQSDDLENKYLFSYLLDNYKISKMSNNVISVKGEDATWKIHRNSTNSLTEPSTEWKIESLNNEGDIYENPYSSGGHNYPLIHSKDGFCITTQPDANGWQIEVVDAYNRRDKTTSSGIMEVQITNNYRIRDYTITMKADQSGKINSNDNILYSTYKITEPLECHFRINDEGSSNFVSFTGFDEGELEMEVRNTNSNQKDPIRTEILNNGDHVLITFLGVSSMFDYYN